MTDKKYVDVDITLTKDIENKIRAVLLTRGYTMEEIDERFYDLAPSIIEDVLKKVVKEGTKNLPKK